MTRDEAPAEEGGEAPCFAHLLGEPPEVEDEADADADGARGTEEQ